VRNLTVQTHRCNFWHISIIEVMQNYTYNYTVHLTQRKMRLALLFYAQYV